MENGKLPIYPHVNDEGYSTARLMPNNEFVSLDGLTKREHFAAMAMQGFLSNSMYSKILQGNNDEPVPSYLAELSVNIADALLAELEKSKP